MPYVEGFGTWPFGEEWLWEAITSSYLPLLGLLEAGAPLTLSLTPVLCDQLEGDGVAERYRAFLDVVRRHTHHEDARGLRAGGHDALSDEVLRSWGDYERALLRFAELDGDLLGALAPYAQWTSSATHAVLPLLATDAGLDAQVTTGIDSHRARFGRVGADWRGGFWLPECAHAPWLEPTLADAGVHASCVELTNAFGPDSPRHLQPLLGDAGVRLVPIDRATMSLVWSDSGYPAHRDYRDYHHHTIHHHNPWANHGGGYDHARALALARAHAVDFVARTRARLERLGGGLPGGGLAVCALDTELLGHWWYEGGAWLSYVVEECASQGLELVRLDDALERFEPAPAAGVWRDPEQVSTWGEHGDLSTWSSPVVAEMAFAIRAAELAAERAGSGLGPAGLRQLLALQSSDWAFMVSRGLAVPYARQRFDEHRQGLSDALCQGRDASVGPLRNLAVHARL
ncbi:MAG TPA: 1,4-alpha-glucan branching protein domain-containing protein [Solirubrobacteraceae bacterium]|jgi:1,4-alpha-glucan branching enzyme